MLKLTRNLIIITTSALAVTTVSLNAQSAGNGTENFRKACELGLQIDYRANEAIKPSNKNLKISAAKVSNTCSCVTNSFSRASEAKLEIIEHGISTTPYGSRLNVSSIGWFSAQNRYIDESQNIDYESDPEAGIKILEGNPLNDLVYLFAPPPKVRFAKEAQNCYRQNIDRNKYRW